MAIPEEETIAAVLQNKDIYTILGIDDNVFGAWADVFRFVKKHYAEHKTVPAKETVERQFSTDKDTFELPVTNEPTKFYADRMTESFLASQMDRMLTGAAAAIKGNKPVDKIINQMTKEMTSMTRLTARTKDVNITDTDMMIEILEDMRQRELDGETINGIQTGIAAIDSCYPGFAPGHLVIPIGFSGNLKTYVSQFFVSRLWEQGHSGMIISLEMNTKEQQDRLYPIMSGGMFKVDDFANADVSIDDFREWSRRNVEGKPDLHIISSEGLGDLTPNKIQAKIDQYKPQWVLIDYIQLMSDNARSSNMTERMLNCINELKSLAMQNSIPIIAISSVTDGQDKSRDAPPTIAQAAWSRGIEYNANMAFAVFRHPGQPGDQFIKLELACRKNRHGPMFNVILQVDPARGVFREDFTVADKVGY